MSNFLSSRLFRFLLAGGVNTAFGFVTYTIFALTSLPTWFVLIAAFLLGMVFNFFTTGGFVFRDLSPARIPRFLLCYGAILAVYWVLIRQLSPLAGGRIGAMLIIIAPMTAATYFLQSRFVFPKAAA